MKIQSKGAYTMDNTNSTDIYKLFLENIPYPVWIQDIDALPESIFYKDQNSRYLGYNRAFLDNFKNHLVVKLDMYLDGEEMSLSSLYQM